MDRGSGLFYGTVTSSACSYGFTNEYQDPTGLVYLRARFYSPELGIFLSRDPFPGFLTQPASLTPYQYAFNNPVRYTDPSGENPLFLLIGAIGGLLGGAIYGYGSQVVRNFNSGDFSECPWAAFTTNIDAGQIAFYAVAGTLLGLGIGGIMVGIQALAGYLGAGGAANIACGGDYCSDEIYNATNKAQNLIDDVVMNEFKNVKLTFHPQFDPNLLDNEFGKAVLNVSTKIGFNAIKFGRLEIIKTIAHEELHHRLAGRGWEQLEPYVEKIASRFAEMIGR
jgi:RHS repeat-associated protein